MTDQRRYQQIEGEDLYRRLALGGRVVVLDVRTLTEFQNNHIPGALWIPLQNLENRIAELPNGGTPIAVICEQGQRSCSACGLLAEHGFDTLFQVNGGLDSWPGPTVAGLERNGCHPHGLSPSSFLVENFSLLPKGLALDVAMGEGRNAIYLATRGFDVDGVDADPERVARARAAARKLGAPIRATVGNFEDGTYEIPFATYDVVTVFNYLHRPLFKQIRDSVRPGGVVVYQTFTVDQAQFGRPTNPDYLLKHDELKQVFDGWEILRYRAFTGPSRREGVTRAIAGIVAKK